MPPYGANQCNSKDMNLNECWIRIIGLVYRFSIDGMQNSYDDIMHPHISVGSSDGLFDCSELHCKSFGTFVL